VLHSYTKFCKRALVLYSAFFILHSAFVFAAPPSRYHLEPSRDPTGAPLPTRAEYLNRFPERPLEVFGISRFEGVRRFPRRDEEGTVVIAVNNNLFNQMEERFERYAQEVAADGWDVVQVNLEGGSPADVKATLIELGGDDLVGVVLCGEIALAWFEDREYFYNENVPDNPRLHEFPIDLFYMDLDGEWQDTSGNGIYDVHSGAWAPDIWLGRIAAYNLSRIREDTTTALYLDRISAYRRGAHRLPHRAVAFIDDDWRIVANQWAGDIGLAFGRVELVEEPETTSASTYRDYLTGDGFELMQVAVHSTADAHAFHTQNRRVFDYFRFRNLREEVAPNVLFYNLFACSVMNLSRNLCMGALYALRSPSALGAVGPAKVGGMLFFDDYYRHMANGISFGESLRRWFALHGREPGHVNWARSWFYGMTHIGDPTLKLRRGLRAAEFIWVDDSAGDNDGIADAGEQIDMTLLVNNLARETLSDIRVELTTNDPAVELIAAASRIGEIESGDEVFVEGFRLRIAPETPDRHRVRLDAVFQPDDGEIWYDRVFLEVRSSRLVAGGFQFDETTGDGNDLVEPGESGSLLVSLFNDGGDGFRPGGRLTLLSFDSALVFDAAETALPAIAPGARGVSVPVGFSIIGEPRLSGGVVTQLGAAAGGVVRSIGMMILPCRSDFRFAPNLNDSAYWAVIYPVQETYRSVWRWDTAGGPDFAGGLAFGGPDTTSYPPMSDGALELPLMLFGSDAGLSIYHRMEAEQLYDGGIVEVNRGEGWRRTAPLNGYNGVAVDNGSFPGGPCWNGSFDWREDRVLLGGPSGPVKVRLRFGADEGVEMGGWEIGRIELTGTVARVQPPPVAASSDLTLSLHPNPLNGRGTVAFTILEGLPTHLQLFDIAGRVVWSSHLEPLAVSMTQIRVAVDWEGVPTGIYYLTATTPQARRAIKVVVMR